MPSTSETVISSVAERHTAFTMSGMDKRKSGPIREDTIGSRNPVHLNSNRLFPLPMTSRRYLGDGLGFVNTQYVRGANTIYVDDYVDEKGTLRKGLKSQGFNLDKERENAMKLNVGFKFGIMDLKKFGGDPLLVEFVNTHESNIESAAGQVKFSTVTRIIRFQPMRAEEKAAAKNVNFEDKMEGMDIVRSLRKKAKDNTYKYDEDKINAIITILGITNKLAGNEWAQKFDVILRFAETDPAEFASIVLDGLQSVEMMIAKAISNEILSMSIREAKLKVGTEPAREIYKFNKETKENERIMHLAYFLLGDPSAKGDYLTIKSEVSSATA